MRFNGFCRFGVLAGLFGIWFVAWARGDVFNVPQGQTSLSLVTVGDPGNAPDKTGFGAVPYTYQISAFDTTLQQYVAMLNSVASSDPYGLYNLSMEPGGGYETSGIVRTGIPGSYVYSVYGGHPNFPVNEVSWGDAARFCNWLANGQPTSGVENATTTESGSYALNGAVTDQQLDAVVRGPLATYVIPTENEWYKASYYKGGSTNEYWLFPTQSDTAPSNVLSASGTNNANYYDAVNMTSTNIPDDLTDVGAFASSPSNYLTYDQGGDVFQLNEERGFRGGSSNADVGYLESDSRFGPIGGSEFEGELGFRIAEVPEPNSVALLVVAGTIILRRRRNA